MADISKLDKKYDAEFIDIITKLVILKLMADRKAKEAVNHAS